MISCWYHLALGLRIFATLPTMKGKSLEYFTRQYTVKKFLWLKHDEP